MVRVSTNECRRWGGERAWESAEGREVERVPRMGDTGAERVRSGAVNRGGVAHPSGESGHGGQGVRLLSA